MADGSISARRLRGKRGRVKRLRWFLARFRDPDLDLNAMVTGTL